MWDDADCVHYVKYNTRLSKPTEKWYTVESRHSNGLMKISHVNPAEEDHDETIEMVKKNHHIDLEKQMFEMNAEKLAESAAEDIYESLPADFAETFIQKKEEEGEKKT